MLGKLVCFKKPHQRCIALALAGLVCVSLSGVAPPSVAAEGAANDGSDQESAQTDKPADTNDKQSSASKSNKGKDRGGDIFRPSEEISEDFAVSFPVDI